MFPKMQVFMLFCMCAAFAVWMPAAPVVVEPVSWPDQGPYREVGDGREWGSAKIPVPVVEFLCQIVREDPTKWAVGDISRQSGYRGRVVEVANFGEHVCLLVAGGRWVNLRAPENVPRLNGIVPPFRAAGLQNEAKLEGYLQGFVSLHASSGRLLTRQYPPLLRDVEILEGPTYYEQWFHGSKKLGQALARLKRNPEVSRGPKPDEVVVRGNVAKNDGSMERWSFYVRVGEVATLERIDIVPLYKRGTFTPVF